MLLGKLPFDNVKADMGNPANLKDVKALSLQNAAAEPKTALGYAMATERAAGF